MTTVFCFQGKSGATKKWGAACLLFMLVSCVAPADQRPGFLLSGERAPLPADWSFTNAYPEIAIQVRTPYGLPHSVTVWCASENGHLFLGAREPETKNWPGWVDRHADVRLRINGEMYDVRLVPVEAPERVVRIRRAYSAKYGLPVPQDGEPPPSIRYWQVDSRSS